MKLRLPLFFVCLVAFQVALRFVARVTGLLVRFKGPALPQALI